MVNTQNGVGSWDAATNTTDTGELLRGKRPALYQQRKLAGQPECPAINHAATR
jgi:hypothetical protein